MKCGRRQLDLVKRYATHDYDSVLGMYYAKARFYDAGDRRFTAIDPILDGSKYDITDYVKNPVELVQYLYVVNNPLLYIDIDGLLTVKEAYRDTLLEGISPTKTAPVFGTDLYQPKDYNTKIENCKGNNILNAEKNSDDNSRVGHISGRERKQINDVYGKRGLKEREQKSKELHDSKEGRRNDDNKSLKDLKEGNLWIESQSFPSLMDSEGNASGLILTIYFIISEGSRLFPTRNLVPIP